MHNPSPFHIADPLLGERVILSLAVTTPLGIAIADMAVRVVSTALVAVLTSLAVGGINAAIRRFQARYGSPAENGAQGAPAKAPPENTRRSGPVRAEEPEDE